MTVTPSRSLNEKSGFLGLTPLDLACLGYLLVFSNGLFTSVGLDWVSFIITGMAAYVLISLRLKFRKKVIRDFLKYQFHSRGIL